MHHNLTSEQQQAVVAAAHGFVSADLMSLCNEAALHALRRYVMIQEAPPAEPQQPQPPPQQQQRQQEEEEVTSTPPEAAAGAGDVPDNNAPQQQQQQQLVVTMDDFAAARARVAPSALRDVAVEVPKVSIAKGVRRRVYQLRRWCVLGP
jgi:SpoVK/Ycf46/Vps4 family AAA+-type ATPase